MFLEIFLDTQVSLAPTHVPNPDSNISGMKRATKGPLPSKRPNFWISRFLYIWIFWIFCIYFGFLVISRERGVLPFPCIHNIFHCCPCTMHLEAIFTGKRQICKQLQKCCWLFPSFWPSMSRFPFSKVTSY